MAGLLDLFGNADDAQRAGLLMLAAAGPRAQPASFGQRLLESVQQFDAGTQQKKERAAQEEERKQRAAQMQQAMQMQAFQMQQAQTLAARQAEQEAATKQFRAQLPSPEMASAQGALAGGGGPTVANAQRMQPVDPNQSLLFKAMQAGQVSPMDYVSSLRKDTAPIKVGAGETLLHPGTMKPLFTNPKVEDTPAAVREYQFARSQGYDKSFDQWKHDQAAAGAANVNVKTDVKTGESLAGQVGKIVSGTRDQALAGLKLVDTAQRVNEALDAKAGVYAGPLANARLKVAQVGDVLGIAGKDTAEKIVNTRNTIRGMAEQAVAARSQLGGQAQISNSEQELLNKATSGDISELTVPELRTIASLNDRLGRQLYSLHDAQMKTLGGRPDLQQLAPFYAVPGLPSPRGNIDDLVNKYRSR